MAINKRRRVNAIFFRLLLGSDRQLFAWFEMLLVTFSSALIWLYQSSLPYETAMDYFYWPMLGPVLIALRYGFGRGMMSFILLLLMAGIFNRIADMQINISVSVSVGTAVITMLVGEFRDHWHDINQRYELNYRYMEQKLASFTQNYHLLKVSHDQLEQRSAGRQISLRTGIHMLQQQVMSKPAHRLAEIAHKSLQVFSDVVGLFQAGLYQVEHEKLIPQPLAQIGEKHQLHLNDLMVKDVLISRAVLSPTNFIEHDTPDLHYQLVIPLVDLRGDLKGVVLAEKVQFISLTDSNIALLALLASYIANITSNDLFAPILQPAQRQLFCDYIQNQHWYVQKYSVDSVFVVFYDNTSTQSLDLYHVTDYRRGADVYWACQHHDGRQALCVLLPMTSLVEANQFIERITKLLAKESDFIADELEVVGPLIISQQQQQVDSLLADLGAHNEDLVDSANDSF
jgi:polysaccharide biosynthesis protein PelD